MPVTTRSQKINLDISEMNVKITKQDLEAAYTLISLSNDIYYKNRKMHNEPKYYLRSVNK